MLSPESSHYGRKGWLRRGAFTCDREREGGQERGREGRREGERERERGGESGRKGEKEGDRQQNGNNIVSVCKLLGVSTARHSR